MGLRTLVCIRGVREGCQLPVSDPHCQSMQWSTVASIASQRSMSPSLPSPYCTYVAPKHCLEKELINAAAIKSSLHWSSTDCSSRPTNTGDALRVNAAWKTRSARSALWCTLAHCDALGYTGMHWDTLGSASHRRNWQGRGSGYFRIRRLSRPDASPYHRHHRHHCYPSSSSPTLEYREAVCAWCIRQPDTIAYDPIWCISSRPAHTQPPSALCCHQEYDNVWLYFNLKK